MIIFNLDLLNTLLALAGIIGWGWVWWFSKYKTGCNIRTQAGVVIFGVFWVALFLADTVQDLHPTTLTVFARFLCLIGLWCGMPLLKKSPELTEIAAPEVTIKKIHIKGKFL